MRRFLRKLVSGVGPGMLSILILMSAAAKPAFAQEYTEDDAPGPLSSAHAESPGLKNCMKCHNEDFEAVPGLCLSCHAEIAERIASERGYHRDKGEACAVCHIEHGGPDSRLIDWDPADFDHEETGTVLKGRHAEISECRTCHRADNTIPRKKTLSYLFRESGCRACHAAPHPGRQEECLACHHQDSWRVDMWRRGGRR